MTNTEEKPPCREREGLTMEERSCTVARAYYNRSKESDTEARRVHRDKRKAHLAWAADTTQVIPCCRQRQQEVTTLATSEQKAYREVQAKRSTQGLTPGWNSIRWKQRTDIPTLSVQCAWFGDATKSMTCRSKNATLGGPASNRCSQADSLRIRRCHHRSQHLWVDRGQHAHQSTRDITQANTHASTRMYNHWSSRAVIKYKHCYLSRIDK